MNEFEFFLVQSETCIELHYYQNNRFYYFLSIRDFLVFKFSPMVATIVLENFLVYC